MAATTSSRPKLAQLKTPLTSTFPSTFPSELSALSARTPLSAFPDFGRIKEEEGIKTPIVPPSAYTDFLKSMTPAVESFPSRPFTNERHASDASISTISSTTTDNSDTSSRSVSPSSAPIQAEPSPSTTSPMTDGSGACSCSGASIKSPPSSAAVPSFIYPTSAPLSTNGRMPGRLSIPPTPASSRQTLLSPLTITTPMSATCPMSACSSAIRSPLSARPRFDWDPQSARNWDVISPKAAGVRHVRETLRRTVTYRTQGTPVMSPAPKGKRRKVVKGEGRLRVREVKEEKELSVTEE